MNFILRSILLMAHTNIKPFYIYKLDLRVSHMRVWTMMMLPTLFTIKKKVMHTEMAFNLYMAGTKLIISFDITSGNECIEGWPTEKAKQENKL